MPNAPTPPLFSSCPYIQMGGETLLSLRLMPTAKLAMLARGFWKLQSHKVRFQVLDDSFCVPLEALPQSESLVVHRSCPTHKQSPLTPFTMELSTCNPASAETLSPAIQACGQQGKVATMAGLYGHILWPLERG